MRNPTQNQLPPAVDDVAPGVRPNAFSDEYLVSVYRKMTRIRKFEEETLAAFAARLVPGTTHVCIGQEAIKVGAIDAVRDTDLVLASYRGHGETIMKGVDITGLFAEIMCRSTGICSGKGGSMHLAEPAVGLVMTNAIVAAHIPIAGGTALSVKMRGTDRVVLCFFGDGAACEGEFFETLNMAMLWRVPLVFICENNGLCISVPTERSQATPDIADRARGVGMPACIVDGNDALAVRAAVEEAAVRARNNEGPSFVECKTVRWERHSGFSAGGSDLASAREAWQRVDPLKRFRKCLRAWQIADDETLDRMDEEAAEEMRRARREAEQAPMPTPDSIYEHIFAARDATG